MAGHVLGISLAVFLALMALGLPLPHLPRQLHEGLGFDLSIVGWVMGIHAAATLLSRPWAGRLTDRRGGKYAVQLGLLAMAAAGGMYGVALRLADPVTVLLLVGTGRVLAGLGEGLVITGAGSWAVSVAGIVKAGQAMSWVGLAMFAGLAAGAAAGSWLNGGQMTLAVILVALCGVWVVRPLSASVHRASSAPLSLALIMRRIARAGGVLGLASVGFCIVSSFIVLLFDTHNWSAGGMAIALFGIGHVLARIVLGSRTDRLTGGYWLPAMLGLEIGGLLLIAFAPAPVMAFAGATLVGLGFSMIYPLVIIPVLKTIPEGSRGVAIGLYDACFDSAMGGAALCGGMIANHTGMTGLYVFAAVTVALAIPGVIIRRVSAPPATQ